MRLPGVLSRTSPLRDDVCALKRKEHRQRSRRGSDHSGFTLSIRRAPHSLHRFYLSLSRLPPSKPIGVEMDIVFLLAAAGLWGLMALLVTGLRKLERPQGGRP